jgi:hypothetical protein
MKENVKEVILFIQTHGVENFDKSENDEVGDHWACYVNCGDCVLNFSCLASLSWEEFQEVKKAIPEHFV